VDLDVAHGLKKFQAMHICGSPKKCILLPLWHVMG